MALIVKCFSFVWTWKDAKNKQNKIINASIIASPPQKYPILQRLLFSAAWATLEKEILIALPLSSPLNVWNRNEIIVALKAKNEKSS